MYIQYQQQWQCKMQLLLDKVVKKKPHSSLSPLPFSSPLLLSPSPLPFSSPFLLSLSRLPFFSSVSPSSLPSLLLKHRLPLLPKISSFVSFAFFGSVFLVCIPLVVWGGEKNLKKDTYEMERKKKFK